MSKLPTAIVASLLIPCLLVDPLTVSAMGSPGRANNALSSSLFVSQACLFGGQALAETAVTAHQLISSTKDHAVGHLFRLAGIDEKAFRTNIRIFKLQLFMTLIGMSVGGEIPSQKKPAAQVIDETTRLHLVSVSRVVAKTGKIPFGEFAKQYPGIPVKEVQAILTTLKDKGFLEARGFGTSTHFYITKNYTKWAADQSSISLDLKERDAKISAYLQEHMLLELSNLPDRSVPLETDPDVVALRRILDEPSVRQALREAMPQGLETLHLRAIRMTNPDETMQPRQKDQVLYAAQRSMYVYRIQFIDAHGVGSGTAVLKWLDPRGRLAAIDDAHLAEHYDDALATIKATSGLQRTPHLFGDGIWKLGLRREVSFEKSPFPERLYVMLESDAIPGGSPLDETIQNITQGKPSAEWSSGMRHDVASRIAQASAAYLEVFVKTGRMIVDLRRDNIRVTVNNHRGPVKIMDRAWATSPDAKDVNAEYAVSEIAAGYGDLLEDIGAGDAPVHEGGWRLLRDLQSSALTPEQSARAQELREYLWAALNQRLALPPEIRQRLERPLRLIVFDKNGTVAHATRELDAEMDLLLENATQDPILRLGVISGAGFGAIQKHFLDYACAAVRGALYRYGYHGALGYGPRGTSDEGMIFSDPLPKVATLIYEIKEAIGKYSSQPPSDYLNDYLHVHSVDGKAYQLSLINSFFEKNVFLLIEQAVREILHQNPYFSKIHIFNSTRHMAFSKGLKVARLKHLVRLLMRQKNQFSTLHSAWLETMVIGNGDNDIEMINHTAQNGGLGVWVGKTIPANLNRKVLRMPWAEVDGMKAALLAHLNWRPKQPRPATVDVHNSQTGASA